MDVLMGVKFFVLSTIINDDIHYNIVAGNSFKTLKDDIFRTISAMERSRRGKAYEIRIRPNIPNLKYAEIFGDHEYKDLIAVNSLDDWDSLNLKRIEVEFDLMQ